MLELNAVAQYRGKIRVEDRRHGDASCDQLCVRQLEDLGDQFGRVERLETCLAATEQCAKAMNDLGSAIVLGDDIAKNIIETLHVSGAAFEQDARRLGVAADRRQRLIQLVGERARQQA